MKGNKTMKTITNLLYSAFALFSFVSFALSPTVRAACQQGCIENDNTVLGDDALVNNTSFDNTAVGFNALESNTTGLGNTAVGSTALLNNTTGTLNIAIGDYALSGNTTGDVNTAVGGGALEDNTTGEQNTAIGGNSLQYNTTGDYNTRYWHDCIVEQYNGHL
jgi:hypothetical protein